MFDLAIRKTHTYVGSHSDLDEWESIGSFEVISSDAHQISDDICEPTDITLLIKVDSEAADEDIKKALRGSLTNAGCSHEWDCCGCVSTHVQAITKDAEGLWRVSQHASRNY